MSKTESVFGRIVFGSWVLVLTLGFGFMGIIAVVRLRTLGPPWIQLARLLRPMIILHVLLNIGFLAYLFCRGLVRSASRVLTANRPPSP
jgi:tetrahydromethanopterin S-methyltransferase subunit D